MDVQAITSIITNVGFPIAVCLICFWYINKMQEQHKAETDKLAEALNNNTLVMQKLINNLENKGGTP
nr:MAG TPA: YvrJ protein family protein [Caudoviricetes sp.]